MPAAVRPHSKAGQYDLLQQFIYSVLPSCISALILTTSLLSSPNIFHIPHLTTVIMQRTICLMYYLLWRHLKKYCLFSQNKIFPANSWPRDVRRGSAAACLLGLRVRMDVCLSVVSVVCGEVVVYDGMITHPEESYRVCVIQCYQV
jgi:hypothetical protein